MSGLGGFAVKVGGFFPVSEELRLDATFATSLHDAFKESMDRRVRGLCAVRHRNGDWCSFYDHHAGTHVTAEGRWIERVEYEYDDGCDCGCDCCGGWDD